MYTLGIDIGSTAVKACVIRCGKESAVVGRGSADYPTYRENGFVEQDPLDWNRASAEAVRKAVAGLGDEEKKQIGGICMSAQGGSVYMADADRKPITRAYTWMDLRAVDEVRQMLADLGPDLVRDACGWNLSGSSAAAKVLWLKKHLPEVYAAARYYYTTEESVTGYLTGNFVTDPTGQVMTRFYDYRTRQNLRPVLDYLGLTDDSLPEVRPCGTVAGYRKKDSAADLGIPEGIPVYTAAHDQYCASIGSGITEPGQLLIATGTAWVVFGVSEQPMFGKGAPAPSRHPIEGRYGIMSSLSGCGGAIGAFAEANGTTPRALDEAIEAYGLARMREECAGYFLCPVPESSTPHRPGVCSTELRIAEGRTAPETALAAMEGACFEIRLLIERFERAGFPHTGELTMSGGASKSPLWRGIMAAVVPHRPLFRLTEADAPALGAAILAAGSCGAYPNLAEASRSFAQRIPVECDPAAAEYYEKKFAAYREWALA